MKLCRFGANQLGVVEGSQVRDVTAALEVLPAYRYPLPKGDPLIANLPAVAKRTRTISVLSKLVELEGLKLLSPVANPTKLVAAPMNYPKPGAEAPGGSANPGLGLFLKAVSSLGGQSEGIHLRHLERTNDHEIELAVVIGTECDRVTAGDALSYVAGYAVGLDITLHGTEDRSFRKSVDSYSTLGPWLVTADEIPNPDNLEMMLAVNGKTRQASNTKHMFLGVAKLIELASSFYTLYPGDVIYTGTPAGLGPIVPGDHITAEIEDIGTLAMDVFAA